MRGPLYRSHSTEKAGFLLTCRGSPYEVTNIGSIGPSRKLTSGIRISGRYGFAIYLRANATSSESTVASELSFVN